MYGWSTVVLGKRKKGFCPFMGNGTPHNVDGVFFLYFPCEQQQQTGTEKQDTPPQMWMIERGSFFWGTGRLVSGLFQRGTKGQSLGVGTLF